MEIKPRSITLSVCWPVLYSADGNFLSGPWGPLDDTALVFIWLGKVLSVLHQIGMSLSYSAIVESLHDFSLSWTTQYSSDLILPVTRFAYMFLEYVFRTYFHFPCLLSAPHPDCHDWFCVLQVGPACQSTPYFSPTSPAVLTPCEKFGTPFGHGHPPFGSVVFRAPCLIS